MMQVGQTAAVTRSFRKEDAGAFAALSGLAAALPPHVPEPLIGGLFSYLLGVKVPGCGSNYLKQDMAFGASAPWDEPITASVTVVRLWANDLVELDAVCSRADGAEICRGRALVLIRDCAEAR